MVPTPTEGTRRFPILVESMSFRFWLPFFVVDMSSPMNMAGGDNIGRETPFEGEAAAEEEEVRVVDSSR